MTKQEIAARMKELFLPSEKKLPTEPNVINPYASEYNYALREVAKRIDALAAGAVKVYGSPGKPNSLDEITPHIDKYDSFKTQPHGHDTHSALLIDIRPLEKPDERVSVEELVKVLRSNACEREVFIKLRQIADRLERHGIKTGEGK